MAAAFSDHQDWQVKAACRGPHASVFFPPPRAERKDEKLDREQRAKGICGDCSVRRDCLEYALRIREPHGIWGGLNEAERRDLLARSIR
jgi:WhiB family transcriptional regulator, redox-sensing transcriptional regulator